jgi:hypothetical protein
MHPDLEALLDLHRADLELRKHDARLAELPKQKAAIEERILKERQALDAAKAALDQTAKDRKRLEGEVQDLEAKRSKYKGQLGEVKTNKEYTALLHEIENVEGQIRSREDTILEEMEKVESGQAAVKKEEAAFKAVEAERRQEIRALEAEIAREKTAREAVEGRRSRIASALKTDLMTEYARIAKARGSSLAEAKDGGCSACHVKLRPQVFLDVKRNDAVRACSSCSRILYFDAPPPQGGVEAPLPPA